MTDLELRSVTTLGGLFLRPKSKVPLIPTLADIEVMRFDRLDVAPAGWSGLRCGNGHFFAATEIWCASAPNCQVVNCRGRGDQDLVAVTATDSALIETPAELHNVSWWHATHAGNKFVDDFGPIHLGTRRAATLRAQALLPEGESFTLWKLQTRAGATIAPDVVMDNSNVDGGNVLAVSIAGTGIVRYVNGREDAGSVSLLGNSSNFELVDSLLVTVPSRIRT